MTATPGTALKGTTVLVTRPAAQAQRLAALIEGEGGVAIRLPLFAVEPVVDPAAARRALDDAYDAWIFTSANAVRHAAPMIRENWPKLVAAVGPATEAALGGAADVTRPQASASSEALLEMDEFQQVDGQRFLIVTGQGGLRVMEETLAARGAQVQRAEVYRRVPLPHPPESVAANLKQARVVIATSGEALQRLLDLTPEAARGALLRKRLVLPSRRVVEMAGGLGFTRLFEVEGPMSDAALCAACVSARDSK